VTLVTFGDAERWSKRDRETLRVLAVALTLLGVLLVAASFLQWAQWSLSGTAHGDARVSIGGGTGSLAVAALGVVLALMGFHALDGPTSWQFGAMLGTSLVAGVVVIGVLHSRTLTAQRLAGTVTRRNCFDHCGVPYVNPGLGFFLAIVLCALAVGCSAIGIIVVKRDSHTE
jgi:hypothetical protein